MVLLDELPSPGSALVRIFYNKYFIFFGTKGPIKQLYNAIIDGKIYGRALYYQIKTGAEASKYLYLEATKAYDLRYMIKHIYFPTLYYPQPKYDKNPTHAHLYLTHLRVRTFTQSSIQVKAKPVDSPPRTETDVYRVTSHKNTNKHVLSSNYILITQVFRFYLFSCHNFEVIFRVCECECSFCQFQVCILDFF